MTVEIILRLEIKESLQISLRGKMMNTKNDALNGVRVTNVLGKLEYFCRENMSIGVSGYDSKKLLGDT